MLQHFELDLSKHTDLNLRNSTDVVRLAISVPGSWIRFPRGFFTKEASVAA
jgi:hypothetical protein